MFKKIVLILLSASLCAAEPAATEKAANKGVSVWKWVIAGVAIGGGVIVAVAAPGAIPAVMESAGAAAEAVQGAAVQAAEAVHGAIPTAAEAAGAMQGALVAAKADIAAGAPATKAAIMAAGPVAGKINKVIFAARLGKAAIYSAPQEKLSAMVQEEIVEFAKVKEELRNCLVKNQDTQQKNALGIPSACEEVAMAFHLYQQARTA
jgi:hypothetical protein